MSEDLKTLKSKKQGEGKKQANKSNEGCKNDLMEKTQRISMPSNKKKADIGKLIPFNMQGNKMELLAKSIGGLVEKAASNSDRVIDAFVGTGAYVHYLRDSGNDKPMLLNEFDPYRFVTHKQLKDNPYGVFQSMKYYVNKLKKMVHQFNDGEEFCPAAKAKQEEIRDFFHKEAERLIEPGQNLTEFFENKLPVKLKNTPELAGLYLIMQNQKYASRPIHADASREGLKKVMGSAEILTIVKDKKNKVKVFRSGKRTIFNPRERIYAVSQRMRNTELRYGDGWKLIKELAGEGDFVPVDTSYLGKSTSNYNKMTQEDVTSQ